MKARSVYRNFKGELTGRAVKVRGIIFWVIGTALLILDLLDH